MAPGREIDLAALHHQLWRVLRLRAGDRIVLLDNEGSAFQCELASIGPAGVLGRMLEPVSVNSEPRLHLILYQCMLKADKFEWVLQKGTELGVTCFVPVLSRRAVVRSGAAIRKKYDRWQAIVREAAEQCGRGRMPFLKAPIDLPTAVQEADGRRLVPWEEAIGERGIAAQLDEMEAMDMGLDPVSLLIGPEGGLEKEEVAQAREAGWQVVTLGQRILRAETAALAATTLAMGWAHELGD